MPNTSANADVICPYYLGAGDIYIACEGLIPGTRTHARFLTGRHKERWLRRVCCTYRYANVCPAAAALSALYEDGK